jgi:DNA-binding transcriptional regulator LsrR (DeoR family)
MQQQLPLPMLTVYEGPHFIDAELVRACATYRAAVRACWHLRTRRGLTQRQLAEEVGLYASHVTDYIAACDDKRELPAKYINAFEIACGNRAITQWHAQRAHVTILEQFLESARRTA